MATLFEIHRPASLDDVIGQDSTIESLRRIVGAPHFTGGAFAFIGASGTGKTSIGRALIADLGLSIEDIFEVGGADCGVDWVRDCKDKFGLASWGESGWKAAIIDESHAMPARAVQAWLPLLEALPKKRLVIFTSTESFECDMFGNFTAPLASRCKVFELELNRRAAAEHLAKIASAAELNGQPIEAYEALLARCTGNMRMALQKIEMGEMLKPYVEPVTAETVLKAVRKIAVPAAPAVRSETKIPAPPILTPDVERALAKHAKYLKGSPNYKASCERLKALGVAIPGGE